MNGMKKKVIFICTHNSARSQMAEGILNFYHGDYYEGYSAGTTATHVNPLVIQVMREIGIDISNHRSKSIDEFLDVNFDFVVTVCDHARETCPYFPNGKHHLHQSFKDPSSITGDKTEVLDELREVRDKIHNWIDETFGSMTSQFLH